MTDPTTPAGSPPPSAWEASPLIQDDERAREVRTRRSSPKGVPFEGCPLFSSDEIGEIPENATPRIRLGIYSDGDEIWFNRRPFPTAITVAEIQKRYGPWRYCAQLWDVNPSVPGSGLKAKLSKVKTVEIRSRALDDIGEEPWPIDMNSPELPQAVRAEAERRAPFWPGAERDAAMLAEAQQAQQQSPGTLALDPYAIGGQQAQATGAPPCPAPPGHCWTWAQGSGWALLPVPGAGAQPAAGGLGGLLAGKSLEELAGTAVMLAKVWKEISGGGAASAEAEERRHANEMQLKLAQQAHDVRMAELNAQFAQMNRAQAPAVDAEAVRAKVMVDVQAREISELRAEMRAAKNAKHEDASGLGDIMKRVEEAKKVASVFGMTKGGPAVEKPTSIDQIIDALDTPAGKSIAEMILSKVLDVPVPAPSPAAPALPPGGPEDGGVEG